MSFWSRSTPAAVAPEQRFTALGVCVALAGASGSATCQEFYVQPRADIGVEVDTNRDLTSTGPLTTAEGYSAEAGATIGIATPESDTTLRPDVSYYDYPRLSENAIRSVLDFASYFKTQRSQFGVYGEFNYADLYSSELASSEFNPLNPNLPTTPETGRISSVGTRTLLTVVPKYEYDLTQRLSAVASVIYQDISYGGADRAVYVSYGYYDATLGLDWKLTPRADISLGVDGSRESARDLDSVTDGHGVQLSYNYQWSKTFTNSFSLVAEQYDIYGATTTNVASLTNSKDTPTGVGATYSTTWKGQISQLQLTLGRTFTPSGAGGSYTSDGAQAEYKRQITARFSFDGAAHYIRNVALSRNAEDGNYNYVIATADIRWMMTRTWYVAGGLQYLDENSPIFGTSARNSMAHVQFGYEGLGRQY